MDPPAPTPTQFSFVNRLKNISSVLKNFTFLFFIMYAYKQASPIGGGGGVVPPTPPRDGPKNQLTFLFKAFFSFFFANHILHAVKCIKMNFFST